MTTGKNKMLDNYMKIYGPTMDIPQVSRVLHIAPKSFRNLMYAGKPPVRVYKVGKLLLCDTADVVGYIENSKI